LWKIPLAHNQPARAKNHRVKNFKGPASTCLEFRPVSRNENLRGRIRVQRSASLYAERFAHCSARSMEFATSGDHRYLITHGGHRYRHCVCRIEKADDRRFGRGRQTNGATAAAKVSAAIPASAFEEMSAMIFRRLWKIVVINES
jgi:hypothetical protein